MRLVRLGELGEVRKLANAENPCLCASCASPNLPGLLTALGCDHGPPFKKKVKVQKHRCSWIQNVVFKK